MVKEKIDLSSWLIASDIDGTINNKARRLVQRNYDMVNKYVYEHKGNFTLASGRSPESMRKHFKRLNIGDGKAIVLNGAGIYDFATEQMVWQSTLNEHCIDMVRKSIQKFPFLAFEAVTDKCVYLFRPTISTRIMAINAKKDVKYFYDFEKYLRTTGIKLFFQVYLRR